MHIFHKWSKWEEYTRTMLVMPGILSPKEQRGKLYESVEMWQKRECLICGYTQRESVIKF